MKHRSFETIRVFFSPILARFRYAQKEAKWRTKNRHNFTTINEYCPIDKVIVGNYTYGKLNVHWYGQEEERLEIGNYCSIAGNVHFVMGGEHNYRRISTFPFLETIFHESIDGVCRGPIIVQDDVWIGFGVTVLSGVTIGQGSVIAAGSVVAKDVPSYSVWIGNKVAKKRFSERIIKQLEQIDYSVVQPEQYRKYVDLEVNDENVEKIVRDLTAK